MVWFWQKKGGDFPKDVGRNDPCPCGSGKKFKKCCYDKIERKKEPKSPNPTPGGY
ncbi:MAG: SEC-C domain-containing protein [Candidatus Omnitrophica bacterium]|nr:SEC-C domain-containing protein [Candidatus Omnitrophota bacterium]